MSEQIMWAVQFDGEPPISVGHTEDEAWKIATAFHGYERSVLRIDGYRCIRVRVTEVQDGRELRAEDLKIEYFRSNRTGMGVDINSTSARATHIPTGLFADSNAERGQYANRQAAIEKLRKLLESENGP
jgi:hypothetical protein